MNLTYLILIIFTALWFLMFFYFKWYVKKRTSVLVQLEEYRTEVIKLNAEIDRITDRDSQLIEDRVKKLKDILTETDRRISAYSNELSNIESKKSGNTEALYTSLGRGIRAALKTEEEPEPSHLSLSAAHPHELASLAPVKETPPPKPSSKRQIRASIDQLLNEGVSPEQAASRLGISIAEVNLAVNLRRGKP